MIRAPSACRPHDGLARGGIQGAPTPGSHAARVIAGLAVAAGAAWGQEALGTVRSVDAVRRVVALHDGTELWVDPAMPLDGFVRGRRVRVRFDERGGKKWIRRVEPTAA